MINNDDDADDIAKKREEAQKEYGIMEEQPRKMREDNSARKNSFNVNKQNPNPKETTTKSTSVAKNNYAGSSLGNKQPINNNLVGPRPISSNPPIANNLAKGRNNGM